MGGEKRIDCASESNKIDNWVDFESNFILFGLKNNELLQLPLLHGNKMHIPEQSVILESGMAKKRN